MASLNKIDALVALAVKLTGETKESIPTDDIITILDYITEHYAISAESLPQATQNDLGCVKQTQEISDIRSPNAEPAALETISKQEFDAVVTLVNEIKTVVNDLKQKMQTSKQMTIS